LYILESELFRLLIGSKDFTLIPRLTHFFSSPMSMSDTEIREKIIQIAASIASSMGLNSNLFEERFELELSKLLSLPGKDSTLIHLHTNRRHTYTLEFLRALTSSHVEGEASIVDIPKVGTENPRPNSSPYPMSHNTHNVHNPHNMHVTYPPNTKGKYKPRGIDVDNTKDAPVSRDRDIVRSHISAPIDMPSTPPVSRGENAWIPTKSKKTEDDPLRIKLNKIRSDLNKISPDNEDIISDRICEESAEECIIELIPTFFDKGVLEQKYREIYARLCVKLNTKFPTAFIPALLKHCQHEFEIVVSEDDEEYEVLQVMKRRIGAIHFIVEMLKVKLLKPDILLLCIDKILKPSSSSNGKEKCEQDVCHVSELIIIATPIIKNKGVLTKLRPTIDLIDNLHKYQFLSQRSKFKIEDAVKMYNMHNK
jgi:hypothetical protein